jgi:predicted transglutaminase-like cysteine proteinase
MNAPQRDPVGADIWRLGAVSGDCDDFAVDKHHRLIAFGLPASALRLSVAPTRASERYFVLVARTDRGDLVLDNLTDAILPFDRAALVFEMIQQPDKPRGRAGVEPALDAACVAAVNAAAR